MTYDPSTKIGGLKANFKFHHVARDPRNKELQGVINELMY